MTTLQMLGVEVSELSEWPQEAQAVATISYTGRLVKPDDTQATLSEGVLSSLVVGTMAVEDLLRLRDLSRRCCERIISFARLSLQRTLQ